MSEQQNHASRAHALLSASSSERWLNCPPSALAVLAYPAQDTEFTREGTLAHEVAEAVARAALNGKDVPHLHPDVDAAMLEHADSYARYIQELTKSADDVVLLEQRVDFSPWVPEGFGTCDCIILSGKTLRIIDYKYGQGVPVNAERNPQMMLYALGALNDYGVAIEPETVEMHIYQPRIDNISTWSLPAADLLEWADKEVKPTAEKAHKGKGLYKAGSWCKFCQHAGKCRTLTRTCTEYVEAHGARHGVKVLAPHEVAEVLTMEPLVALWLKRVKDQALTTLLDGGEIPGYKVVEGKLGNRKWTDELQVLDALTAAGYDRETVTETKLLSPAQMDKAVGKKRAAELLEEYISRSPGAPTVVAATDKRPAYDRVAEAKNDFND